MADTVNSQITDAITQTAAATVGQAASVALGMFFQAEAQAFALSMQNAVTAQHNVNQIGEAVTAVATAKILALLGK
ncbi:MAG: RebB family R body protein [Kofleriaceae bacterium]